MKITEPGLYRARDGKEATVTAINMESASGHIDGVTARWWIGTGRVFSFETNGCDLMHRIATTMTKQEFCAELGFLYTRANYGCGSKHCPEVDPTKGTDHACQCSQQKFAAELRKLADQVEYAEKWGPNVRVEQKEDRR